MTYSLSDSQLSPYSPSGITSFTESLQLGELLAIKLALEQEGYAAR